MMRENVLRYFGDRIKTVCGGLGCGSVVEHMPSMCEALAPSSSLQEKNVWDESVKEARVGIGAGSELTKIVVPFAVPIVCHCFPKGILSHYRMWLLMVSDVHVPLHSLLRGKCGSLTFIRRKPCTF